MGNPYVQGLYKKAETGEELRIRMDPLRGSVKDSDRPGISSPVRSIKMYSYAQCTVQQELVCGGDVPCLAHMEQGSSPLHPEHLPSLPLGWVVETQFTGSLQEGWIWTVKWRFAASPSQILCFWIMYAILSYFI
jgi:hypothetical protein